MVLPTNLIWPALPYQEFKSTGYLLHMLCQAIGKFKLFNPFEPEWANVVLTLTSRGLTTGPIAFEAEYFAIDLDLLSHKVSITSSWNQTREFDIGSTSVAAITETLFNSLSSMGISLHINTKPQEIPNPIAFELDTTSRIYSPELANNWWRILLSSQIIFQHYHSKFTAKTQPLGFMWGTFDLRDVRYSGEMIQPTDQGFIRRNAMDAALIECGWWSGNEAYPKAAYYSFTFPEPAGIEKIGILPASARWDANMKLFILDYDDLRRSATPEKDLLGFLNSTYEAGAKLAKWDSKFIGSGEPV